MKDGFLESFYVIDEKMPTSLGIISNLLTTVDTKQSRSPWCIPEPTPQSCPTPDMIKPLSVRDIQKHFLNSYKRERKHYIPNFALAKY